MRLLFVALLSTLTADCHGGRILAIFQSQSEGNFLAFEPLVRELAARGHNVTVIGSFPRGGKAVGNYTDIYVPVMGLTPHDPDSDQPTPPTSDEIQSIRRCRHILRQDPVKHLANPANPPFDLVLLEFRHHQCFLGFALAYGCPLIGLSSEPGDAPSAHDLMGNSSPYAYVPHPLASPPLTDRMGLAHRLTNAASLLTDRLVANFRNAQEYENILGDYFERLAPLPSVAQLQRKMGFILFNADAGLGYPRPLLPNMADVAGLHIRPTRKLTKDLQTFLDESEGDVLVVDMGSHPSQSVDQKLRHAFSKLRQTVLWKREKIPGQTPNVRVKKSFPLVDVLAHPKVRALLTRGDQLTMQDGVYQAVPMVGVPLEPGHAHNLRRAEDLGFAILLDEGNVTSRSVQWAVDALIRQTSYALSARKVSQLLRDQPIPPLDKAVYWTEYVMRYRGAIHLQSAARDMPWHQYLLLDVLALLALVALVVTLAAYKALRWADRYLFGYEEIQAKQEKKLN